MDTNISVLCVFEKVTSEAECWTFYLLNKMMRDGVMEIATVHCKELVNPNNRYFYRFPRFFRITGRHTETYAINYLNESNMMANWTRLISSKMQEAVYQGKEFRTYPNYDSFFEDFSPFLKNEFKRYFGKIPFPYKGNGYKPKNVDFYYDDEKRREVYKRAKEYIEMFNGNRDKCFLIFKRREPAYYEAYTMDIFIKSRITEYYNESKKYLHIRALVAITGFASNPCPLSITYIDEDEIIQQEKEKLNHIVTDDYDSSYCELSGKYNYDHDVFLDYSDFIKSIKKCKKLVKLFNGIVESSIYC